MSDVIRETRKPVDVNKNEDSILESLPKSIHHYVSMNSFKHPVIRENSYI